jgi:uncharacterized protein YdhG (YjbR/CyaY superfamily)
MKYNVGTIEEYLEVIPLDRKEIIMDLIALTKEYFPDIEGNMEYNMPTFNPVCAIASQKHHISIYIHKVDLVEKYRNELGNLKVGKSCIRFRKKSQLPEKTIRRIFKEIAKK